LTFSPDDWIRILFAAVAVVLLGALGLSIWRRETKPVRIVNFLLSAAIVIRWIPDAGKLVSHYYIDEVPAWVGFELLVLIASAVSLWVWRLPPVAAWIGFTGHVLGTGFGLLFMFTFKLTRLM